MGLNYENLDAETRRLMVEEIAVDVADGTIYLSNYLNEGGQRSWPGFLQDAAQNSTDDVLAALLREHGSFKQQVERRKPKGGYTLAAVPVTAAQTLSESQFNMYYMRALAIRAKREGKTLTVYRAKEVDRPRPESEQMIGKQLDPEGILAVLRETHGVEPSINIPLPNSGLTIRLS